jgi:hypothetical protein
MENLTLFELWIFFRVSIQALVTNRNSNSEFLSEKELVIAYSSRHLGFGFKENNLSLIEQR